MRPRIPKVDYAYYPLGGGLDLVTPAISVDPGRCFDSQNYEPDTVAGYRRINGFERFDGRTSPSSASYWVLTATITGTVTVGATLTGLTSSATGKVLAVDGTTIVLGRVTGTYQSGEALQIAAVTQATATSDSTEDGATMPSDDADYRLLAADDLRADILAVTGGGDIRGIWLYKDVWYAFRDNAGGTAGTMWKSTTGGWVQITFKHEIQFTNAVGEIFAGNTITGLTSGATAVVVKPLLRTGTWTAAGAGTLVITTITGTFQNGEALQVTAVTKATSSSLATAITRAPGGRLEFVNANFTGSTDTEKMYGADGVNLAFEFDGTDYIPIRTGMSTDTPKHIGFHRNYLFLSFRGSSQNSSLGNPYAWTVVTGAAEITTGAEITGYRTRSGNASGAALSIFTAKQAFTLYGTSTANFSLVPSDDDLGFEAYTIQQVSNDTYGLSDRGVQSLITTLNYGDFQFAARSFLVQPLLQRKMGLQTASTTLRAKNQYRLYFNDGTGLVFGLTGDKMTGIMLLNYGKPVLCMSTGKMSTGEEVTCFGSDDGYIYMDNVGTSFDGEDIEAWIRPVFNNLQSPRVRKQFRRATFEVKTEGYSVVNITYDIGYASPLTSQATVQQDQSLIGAGGYWDQFTWDQFTWDSPIVESADLSIDGTDTNVSFLFYSKRAQDDPHTVQGVNLLYNLRRLVHSGT